MNKPASQQSCLASWLPSHQKSARALWPATVCLARAWGPDIPSPGSQPLADLSQERCCFATLILMVLTLLLTGCGTYRLEGKVIEGEQAAVEVVPEEGRGFGEPGIAGTRISVIIDPRRLDYKKVGEGRTGADGRFSISIDALGAGFLEHQVQVSAVKKKYETTVRLMQLPSNDKKLLIALAPGESEPPPRRGRFREETLEMSDPYLDDRPGLTGDSESP